MNHKPRISILVMLFLIGCVLTVALFASLPAYASPVGPVSASDRSFGPVTHETTF